MRRALSVLLGLLVFLGIDYALQQLGLAFGIASHITYDEPVIRESYDQTDEIFGETTALGYAIAAFSAVVATWFAKATYAGSLWERVFSVRGRRWFLAWLFGSALLVVLLGVASYVFSGLHFAYKSYVAYAVQCLLIGSVAWTFYRWGTARPAEATQK